MKLQTVINILDSYEKENIRVELKESQKFITGEDRFEGKEMASIIVSFANREGGMLIVGVKDDGTFEGEHIFDKFSVQDKNGFDKFKEYIENICKDSISPQIFVESFLFKIEGHDVAVIKIPKRLSIPHAVVSKHEGSIVRTREYYIRTTHGKALVSDRHLEWLFNNTDLPRIFSEAVVEITVDKNLMRVPRRLGAFERFPTQPQEYHSLNRYLNVISPENLKRLKRRLIDRERLIREILIYSIIRSVDFKSDHNKSLPTPSEKMIMNSYMGEGISHIIHQRDNLWSVPFGTSMKIKSTKEGAILKFGNKSILGVLTLKTVSHTEGVSEINPYAQMIESLNRFETFTIACEYQVDFKYPEDFDEDYDAMFEFANALQQTLKEKWDIVDHFNGLPHYKLLYEIDYKLNQLIDSKKQVDNKGEKG